MSVHSYPYARQEGDPAPSGGTSVLERTEIRPEKSDGDNERYAHYVKQDRLKRSGTGQAVVALCGKVWVPMRDPKGYPVCPKCQAIYKEMRSHGPGWPFVDGGGASS
ncbi:MAG: DUF3039 domain-containing protein [Actinomycetaceae bacterium]|nr:DUF3039 domain-containing protein [Actinomycetaceae bacterium]MDU0970223.1 DUF3039 domain-containing protein [Actinomycetaceae bacterium]